MNKPVNYDSYIPGLIFLWTKDSIFNLIIIKSKLLTKFFNIIIIIGSRRLLRIDYKKYSN